MITCVIFNIMGMFNRLANKKIIFIGFKKFLKIWCHLNLNLIFL